MTEPVNIPTRARLEELAAVTKGYGRYFGGRGFAFALTGAWMVGCGLALRASPRAGQLLWALAPLLWMALAARARRYYQRHGEVVAPDELGGFPYREVALGITLIVAVQGVMAQFDGPRRGYELLAVTAFVATPMAAIRFVRWDPNLGVVFGLEMIAVQAQRPERHGAWVEWAQIAVGAFFVGLGTFEHWRYRRLERRLLALKGNAA